MSTPHALLWSTVDFTFTFIYIQSAVCMCSYMCGSSGAVAGMTEMDWSDVLLGHTVQQSSTLPRPPPRTSRHHRRASDEMARNGHELTPVKAVMDTPAGASSHDSSKSAVSERPLRTPTNVFASPVAVSPPSNVGVLAPTNTRRIGNRFCIDLVKG